VLIVGGKTGTTTAELFDPAVGSGTFAATAALPAGEDKRHHTAVLLTGVSPNAGKVLISGGVTGAGNGTPSSTQFLYDRTSATFDATAPALATPRSNHAAIELANTNVLICGGTSDGTNTLRSCELFDHAGGSGVQLPTADMIEFRKDFALAPMKISSFTQIIAAGSPSTPMNFAEAYDEN